MRYLPLILTAILLALPGRQMVIHAQETGTYEETFTKITELLPEYDKLPNVSFMKVGRVAMSMGKTVGKAAINDSWLNKVIKAFRKVNGVYMLDYGEASPETREKIEKEVKEMLPPENLLLRGTLGSIVTDETYGATSANGKEVSDLVIVLCDQSVVCIRGTLHESDLKRTVGRLKKQL